MPLSVCKHKNWLFFIIRLCSSNDEILDTLVYTINPLFCKFKCNDNMKINGDCYYLDTLHNTAAAIALPTVMAIPTPRRDQRPMLIPYSTEFASLIRSAESSSSMTDY